MAKSCDDKQSLGARVRDLPPPSLSLSLSLSLCSFVLLFNSFSAHPSSHIIALTLHSFCAFLSFHTFIVYSD